MVVQLLVMVVRTAASRPINQIVRMTLHLSLLDISTRLIFARLRSSSLVSILLGSLGSSLIVHD